MSLFLAFIKRTKKDVGISVIATYILISIVGALAYKNDLITKDYIQKFYYSIITIIEYLSFSLFIWYNVVNKLGKKIIIFMSLIFILFIMCYTTLVGDVDFDSVPIGVETIFILVLSAYFLYERINDPKTLFIYTDYRFWIVLAFMIYLSGSFFIYIFANQIPKRELAGYWDYTYVFYIIKNILFSIGILIYISNRPSQKRHVQQSVKYY